MFTFYWWKFSYMVTLNFNGVWKMQFNFEHYLLCAYIWDIFLSFIVLLFLSCLLWKGRTDWRADVPYVTFYSLRFHIYIYNPHRMHIWIWWEDIYLYFIFPIRMTFLNSILLLLTYLFPYTCGNMSSYF